jgi:hypothetical protein
MDVEKYLEEVAYIEDDVNSLDGSPTQIYKSKFDDSYITRVDMEDSIKHLAELEITRELTHGVGFSPKDGKWYGWSHRAIYGFEIGSECKKGDCHYIPDTPEKLIDDHAEFFADISEQSANQRRAECQILPDRSGIRILTTPIKMQIANSMDELAESIDEKIDLPEENIFEDSFYEIKCGKGEWVAKTMEDAKQMAIDFNEGVS